MQKELTVEELRERWEWLLLEGIDELRITEVFRNGTKSYVVTKLEMELEDEFAMCTDYKGVITTNYSVLTMFLQTSLTKIILEPHKDWYQETLEFGKHGFILIEKA